MGDLLIQKTVPAEECERFANALTGRECRCDPSKLYTISVKAHGVTEQHQGEPVAWLTKCKQSGLVEQAEPNEKASNPEHWTDAFPVYDSPKSARSQFDYDRGFAAGTAECETLRAKLAERDELLRYVDDQLTNMQPHIEQACYPGRAGFIDNYVDPVIERIRALSASAEPSAPKIKIRVPEGLLNCIEGNRVPRPEEKLFLFRLEEFGAVGDGVTDDTEAFRASVEAAAQFANPAELTDEQIIEVMHTHLNNADGGYVVDTAPGDVVKAGRALLACAGRSAPVERDERSEFEAHYLIDHVFERADFEMDGDRYVWQATQDRWEAWQARAALERKP